MEFSVGSHHLTRGIWGPEFGLETPVRASYGQGEAVCAVRAGGFLEPNHITVGKSHNFSVPWFPHTPTEATRSPFSGVIGKIQFI